MIVIQQASPNIILVPTIQALTSQIIKNREKILT